MLFTVDRWVGQCLLLSILTKYKQKLFCLIALSAYPIIWAYSISGSCPTCLELTLRSVQKDDAKIYTFPGFVPLVNVLWFIHTPSSHRLGRQPEICRPTRARTTASDAPMRHLPTRCHPEQPGSPRTEAWQYWLRPQRQQSPEKSFIVDWRRYKFRGKPDGIFDGEMRPRAQHPSVLNHY